MIFQRLPVSWMRLFQNTFAHGISVTQSHAFEIRLSNGFTEGCNNAIKTLKRASFGCRDFSHFRKRVLLSFSLHPNI